MRNLKRALSLTLASVMLLGMMVMGTSAAGFPDVDNDNNVEAIEVLNEVGVILGDDNGNFRPDDLVTRAEMAAIMSRLLDLDYQYYEGTCPFSDVPDWAKAYVGACYSNGVIKGYNATTYGASDGITPVQGAAMMLRALGYFKYNEDYKDGFEVATVRQGTEIGLFDGVGSSATATMTRDQVAKMGLNALKSEMVSFTGTPGIEVNGVVVGYRPEYTPRTSTESKYQAIENRSSDVSGDSNHRGQYYIQLGEQLYNGELRLDDDAIDDFGRPARYWEYKGKDIGTYAKTELLKKGYDVAVKGQDMYELLGNSVVTSDKYSLYVYVDGWNYDYTDLRAGDYGIISKENFTRNNKADLEHTGRGVLTEVYVDTNTYEITVAIINTYLAKAIADYSANTEKVTVQVYNPGPATTGGDRTKDLLLKDFPQVESIKKDDLVLVQWADSSRAAIDKDVVTLGVPEIMDDSVVTKFSTDGAKVTKLTTGGTQYESAKMLKYESGTLDEYYDTLLTDKTYDIYLDQYGNAIGVKLHSGTDNYLFITGYDLNSSNYAITRGSANAIFLDGTMRTITVDVKETNKNINAYNTAANGANNSNIYALWNNYNAAKQNTWYKYTESNDVYTLKPVDNDKQFAVSTATGSTFTLDNKHIRQTGDNLSVTATKTGLVGWADDKTTVVAVDVNRASDGDAPINSQYGVIDEVLGCYTGIDNVSIDIPGTSSPIAYYVMNSSSFLIGAVVIGSNNGSNNNYAYIFDGAKSERFEADGDSRSTNGTYYWEIDAVIDGEWKENVEIKTKYPDVITTIKDQLNTYVDQTGGTVGNKFANGYLFRLSYDGNGYVTSAKPYDELAGTTYAFANSAGGWNTDIDKQSVRFMNVGQGLETTGQTLDTRIERTIKNTNKLDDKGLRVATDCVFVVRQKEFGKWVTRTYTALDTALAEITAANDTRDNKSVNYWGTVAAVMDGNGQAKWVVFDNRTELYADKNHQGSGANDYYTYDYTVYGTGYIALTVNVDRPEWLANTAALPFSYDIYVDGRPYATTTGSISATYGSGTDTWANGATYQYMPVAANARVTVENFTFNLANQYYKVVARDQNGNVLPDSYFASPISTQTVYAAAAGTTVSFQFNGTGTWTGGTYDWAWSNVVDASAVATKNATGVTLGTPGQTTTNPVRATADLKDFVYLTINTTGLTANTQVNVTNQTAQKLNAVSGAPAGIPDAFTVTVTTNRATEPGGAVMVTYTAAGSIATTENYGYKAILSDGTEVIWVNDASVPTPASETVVLTANKEITIVSVQKLAAPTVTSVSIKDENPDGTISAGDVITISFSESGCVATVVATGGIVIDDSLGADGIYTITTAPAAAGDKLTVTVASADGVTNTTTWDIVTDSTKTDLKANDTLTATPVTP